MKFVAIDFETADYGQESACAVTLVRVEDGECTVRLARATWGIYPTKLPDVCRRLRIPLRRHDAASDAEACARIVIAASERMISPRVTRKSAPSLTRRRGH